MKKIAFCIALGFIVFFTMSVFGQSPLDGFDPNVVGGYVYSIAVQTDGKILIGGAFTSVQGTARNNIARVNPDGSLDNSFDPDADHWVEAIVIQDDGKILIGGGFENLGSTARNYIARLNTDGSVDTSYNPSANYFVRCIAIQPDGKILVGGDFTSICGTSKDRIARLNTDGSLDTDFSSGTDSTIESIVMQSDGRIVIGGGFTNVAGTTRNRIARLYPNGDLDISFSPSANGHIETVSVQPDRKILINGGFTSVNGIERNRIARLDVSGNLDTGFDPNANGVVRFLAVQSDGQILIGGDFSSVGGITRNYIARIYIDGSLDASFNPSADGSVRSFAIQPDGKILLGGAFATVVGTTRNRIARLYPDGSLDKTIDPSVISQVNAIAIQADGKVLFGNSSVAAKPVRLYPDGSIDTSFLPFANGGINSIAIQSDGKIVIGGGFTAVSGITRNRIARLNPDGSVDAGFAPSINDHEVRTIVVQSDGKILIGGSFMNVNGVERNFVARLNADGTLDASFNPNASYHVYCMAIQSDGKILIGGQFDMVGGKYRKYLARLDSGGSVEDEIDLNLDGYVYAIAVQPDGNILLGGGFTTGFSNRMARLTANGSYDTTFAPNFNNHVESIALQLDGKIIVGGMFTSVGGTTRNYIAMLNPDGSLVNTYNPNADYIVYSVVIQNDGKVWVGGVFSSIGGTARNGIARLSAYEAAIQELKSETRSQTQWLRSGGGPETGRVFFEGSSDTINWSYLGQGSRITGGWEITGLDLPQAMNYFLRAKGYAHGGYGNACTSVIESVKLVYYSGNYLTVNIYGTGNGTVTSDPSGIDCGSGCSKDYPPNTYVSLNALAEEGSTFAGWSGDCSACGTSLECTVFMDGNKSCTAMFVLNPIINPAPLFTSGTTNNVSWNISPEATAYEAQVSSDNFLTIFATSGEITDTFYNFTGLTSGTDYQYRVRAVYPWGISDWSQTVHSTQDATSPSSVIVDPLPSGLLYGSIYAVTGTASDTLSGVGLVELSWDGGANWYPATGTSTWTYNWTLPSDGNYTLSVRATDAVGNIETMHSIPVTVRNRPSPATSVNAVDVPYDGGGIIDITWILSADDGGGMNYISGYSIYRANSAAGPFQKIAWVLAGTAYAQDTNAGGGINRYYKVRAETDWDVTPNFTDSEIFGPIASTDDSPLPVNNLQADLTYGCNVRLVWIESPSPDILLYNIYCDNGTGTVNYSTPLGTVSAPATTWVSSGLALDTAYIFAVRAKDLSGKEDGLTANQVSITTECSSGIVRAEIKQPQAGRKIKGTKVTVLAQLIQGDASGTRDVLFQYRTTGGGTWTNIVPSGSGELNPDPSSPYTLHWNSTLLPDGDYDLRSVATNLADQQDGAPPYVTVTIDNVNGNLQEDSTDGNHQAVFETYRGSGNSNLTAMERDMTEVQLTIPKGSLPVSIGNTTLREEDPAIYGLKQAKGIFKGATGFFVLSETLNAAGVYRTIELPSGLTSFSTWADLVIFYRDDDNDGIVDGTTIPALQLDLFRLESGDDWSLQNSNRTVDTVNKFIRVTITQAGTFGLFSYPKPQAVNDLKVEPSGNDARIYWPAVTLDDKGNAITVDHYNIYIGATPDFSPDLINHANLLSGGAGQVVGLQTYDVGALTGTESRFYLATAVDGTGKESYPR